MPQYIVCHCIMELARMTRHKMSGILFQKALPQSSGGQDCLVTDRVDCSSAFGKPSSGTATRPFTSTRSNSLKTYTFMHGSVSFERPGRRCSEAPERTVLCAAARLISKANLFSCLSGPGRGCSQALARTVRAQQHVSFRKAIVHRPSCENCWQH